MIKRAGDKTPPGPGKQYTSSAQAVVSLRLRRRGWTERGHHFWTDHKNEQKNGIEQPKKFSQGSANRPADGPEGFKGPLLRGWSEHGLVHKNEVDQHRAQTKHDFINRVNNGEVTCPGLQAQQACARGHQGRTT